MSKLDYEDPDDRVVDSLGRRSHTIGIERIAEALIASGYTSLDAQAKALGIHRSTAWTIVRAKHKLGRLSAKTSGRILANPRLPPRVRDAVQQYLTEKSVPRERTSRTILSLSPRRSRVVA
jgi:hypothetical protein